MDPFYEAGLAATRWLQASYPGLLPLMRALSSLELFGFLLTVTVSLYWSFNKRTGKHLIFLLAMSAVINGLLKAALRAPRPFWLDPDLRLWSTDTFGFPSSHVQTATVFFTFLAYRVRRGWFRLFAIIIIIFVAISRIYGGVHFIHDVLAGTLFGVLMVIGYILWRRYFYDSFRNRILGQRLLTVLSLSLALAVLFIIVALLVWRIDLPWEATLVAVARSASYERFTIQLAALTGLSVGFIFEVSRIRFIESGRWWHHLLRLIGGLGGAGLLLLIFTAILPNDPLWLHLPGRFVTFTLLGLWLSYYWPWLFVRLGLAEAAPEPEVKLSVSKNSLLKG